MCNAPVPLAKMTSSWDEVGNVALRVNTQNIKVKFQKILKFFLTVFFCCDVGESDIILKPRYGSFNVIYRKSQFYSINERIAQKYLCFIQQMGSQKGLLPIS